MLFGLRRGELRIRVLQTSFSKPSDRKAFMRYTTRLLKRLQSSLAKGLALLLFLPAVSGQEQPSGKTAPNTVSATATATTAGEVTPASGANTLPPPAVLTGQQEHQRLMDLLHVTSIRRGRDGSNTNSPYYANYNESKANPFPNLPDPLVLKDGRKITTAEMWWKERRPEIVEDFDR